MVLNGLVMMKPLDNWISDFFISKGRLFGEVLRAERMRGVEEAKRIAKLLERHGIERGPALLI